MKALVLILPLLAGPVWAQPAVPASQPEQPPLTLRVGVRIDAPPFSYRPPARMLVSSGKGTGPLGEGGYAGYMVFVCDRVLEVMSDRQTEPAFSVVPVPVEASDRFEKLGREDGGIDILCDPSTATRERVRDHTASLPLYLSGIGYAAKKRERSQETGAPRIAVVGSTTASDHGIRRILDAGEWPGYRDQLMNFIHNPNVAPTIGPRIQTFESHRKAVAAFCGEARKEPPLYRRSLPPPEYYVGDQEIVNRALLLYGSHKCKAEPARTTYSDDRYVLFMRNADSVEAPKAKLLMTFSRILSELVLSQPSLLDEAFEANFEGYQRSDKLRLFFWSLYGP